MSKIRLHSGLFAASVSVALIAGCASPAVPPTTAPADVAGQPTAAQPGTSAETPAAQAPAAVSPVTLAGKATFRGEALAGYAISVLDAQTGKPVALKDDLAGAAGLTVLNKNLMTDAQGAFSLQVVGLKAGQALRVVITKGNGQLETIVTSNLTALGAKKMRLLDAENANGLTINELTTAIAKIARGVISTTLMLSPDAAAPILAKLNDQLATISAKLEATLATNPGLANGLVSTDPKAGDGVKALVSSAGALKDVTQTVAGLVAAIAKDAKDHPAADAGSEEVKAELAKIEYYGTVLAGALSNGNLTLTNSVTGDQVDATSGDVGSVGSTVGSSGGSSSSGPTTVAHTGTDALNYMAPENFNTNSDAGYKGLNVGFKLKTLKVSDLSKVEVSLYNGSTLLVTNTTNAKFLTLADTEVQHSTPFITKTGTYTEQYWTLGTYNWLDAPKPTKAVIKATDKSGNTYTVENTALSEDTVAYTNVIPRTYADTAASTYVVAENFNTHGSSDYHGLNVGYRLVGLKNSAIAKAEVSLYHGTTLLVTNTGINTKLQSLGDTTTQFSTPFLTRPGTYAEEYWTLGQYKFTSTANPDKAVITLTETDGDVYKVQNTNLVESDVAYANILPQDWNSTNGVSAFLAPTNFNTNSDAGYKGLNVGFKYTTMLKHSDLAKVEVSLYNGSTPLATNVGGANLLAQADSVTEDSTPFITKAGTYTETYWTLGAHSMTAATKPTRAVVKVTDKYGNTFTVENSSLSEATAAFSTLF